MRFERFKRFLRVRLHALDFARLKRLSKEGGWIVAASVMSVLSSLVLVRVLTGYLDPTEYGRLTLTLTLGVLVCQVAFGGSMPGIQRYYAIAAEKGKAGVFIIAVRQMLFYAVIIALLLGSVLLVGLSVWGREDLIGLTIITIIFAVLSNFNVTQSMIQNAARQRQIVALHSTLDAWLKIALALLLLKWMGNSAEQVVLGYILSLLIVLASGAFFLHRLIPERRVDAPELSEWRVQIWHYSKPYVVINLFSGIQASADRWALESYVSTADVGLYATLLQLGYGPIIMITGLATTLLGPILFARSGDASDHARNHGVHRLSWRLTNLILFFTALGVIFTWTLHPLIFRILVAEEYRTVSYLLPWMVLAGGLLSASQVLGLKMQSELKTHAMLWPKVITALLGVVLYFTGAYQAGLNGVVVAMVIFSLVHFLWFAALTLRPAVRSQSGL